MGKSFTDYQDNSTLNRLVKVDENKSFAKTRHNPSIVTDFECKLPK